MSRVASGRFCSPNWIGVNMRLKTILRKKGRNNRPDSLLVKKRYVTYPKEAMMMIYNTVHTGPNIHAGGAQSGFMRYEYRS